MTPDLDLFRKALGELMPPGVFHTPPSLWACEVIYNEGHDLAARVEAIRVGLGAAGHEDWRRVVEALFGPRGVLLYPDGTLELRGSVAVGSDLAPVRLSARARRG